MSDKKNNTYLSDTDYNFIYSAVPRICIDLIIKGKGGVFLTKRDIQPYKGNWHLAGGRIRFRETIYNAANRIAITELGCSVSIVKMIGFIEFHNECQDGNKRHSISMALIVNPLSDDYLRYGKFMKEGKIHPVQYKFLKINKLI